MDLDMSRTIVTKSDQLNADDLIGGPIVVRIEDISVSNGEQPVAISITGGWKPWKPCKTMRRVLVHAWGADAAKYRGKWLVLYRDPKAKWGGEKVGGIRIEAMSDIPSKIEVTLNETSKTKAKHVIEVFTPKADTRSTTPAMSVEAFTKAIEEHGIRPDDFAAWRVAEEKADIATLTDDQRGILANGLRPGAPMRAKFTAWITGRES